MSFITFIVEYRDGAEPPVSADMKILGGRLVAVSWSNALKKIEYHHDRCGTCRDGARGGCSNCAMNK